MTWSRIHDELTLITALAAATPDTVFRGERGDTYDVFYIGDCARFRADWLRWHMVRERPVHAGTRADYRTQVGLSSISCDQCGKNLDEHP